MWSKCVPTHTRVPMPVWQIDEGACLGSRTEGCEHKSHVRPRERKKATRGSMQHLCGAFHSERSQLYRIQHNLNRCPKTTLRLATLFAQTCCLTSSVSTSPAEPLYRDLKLSLPVRLLRLPAALRPFAFAVERNALRPFAGSAFIPLPSGAQATSGVRCRHIVIVVSCAATPARCGRARTQPRDGFSATPPPWASRRGPIGNVVRSSPTRPCRPTTIHEAQHASRHGGG